MNPYPTGSFTSRTHSQRLHIGLNPDYKVSRTVDVSEAEVVTPTNFHFDFDFERRVVAEAERAGAGGGAGRRQGELEPDETEVAIAKYMGMGLGREPVAMALAVVGRDDPARVADFCKHFDQMQGMGFLPDIICGALSRHNMDVNAAINECLSQQ